MRRLSSRRGGASTNEERPNKGRDGFTVYARQLAGPGSRITLELQVYSKRGGVMLSVPAWPS